MSGRPPNATAASLLGFLHWGPMSGWDLAETAKDVIGDFWSLTRSQVYRELAALAKAGLIEAGTRGARERQPYTLTASGRAAFAEWASREPGPELIRFPLLLKVSFGRFIPADRLGAFLRSHRAIHAQRLAAYEAAIDEDEGRDAYRDATLAFGIAYERAVLVWFNGLSPELRGSQTARPRRRKPR